VDRASSMKVVFFCQDGSQIEQLVLALRLRWPDLRPLIAPQGEEGLQLIEQEEPELVFLCQDLPDMGVLSAIKEIRRFSDVPIVVTGGELQEDAMKKWDVNVTVTFTLGAGNKKDAMRAAMDRLECEGEEGYHIFAGESPSDDSWQEDRPDGLTPVEPAPDGLEHWVTPAPDALKQVEPAPDVLKQIEPAPDVLKQIEPAPDGMEHWVTPAPDALKQVEPAPDVLEHWVTGSPHGRPQS